MAEEQSKFDKNFRNALIAITDDIAQEIRNLLIDPATGRLKVQATISGTPDFDNLTINDWVDLPEWKPAFDYSVGQVVVANNGISNNLYQSNSIHTSLATFALDSASWDLISTGSGGSLTISTANFNRILSALDNTPQKAFDTLDNECAGLSLANIFALAQTFTSGFKDTDVTTAVKLGDALNTVLNTVNKTILGSINELKTRLDSVTNPLLWKGTISVASDFPTLALVQLGWFYHINADVTDNDATKTNTGLSFKLGDDIAWDGTTWEKIGGSTSLWLRTGTDLSPLTAGDNVNLGTGGFKDANVTTPIYLGAIGDTSFLTTKKSIVGAVNELKNINDIAKFGTGFVSPKDVNISGDAGSRTVTLTGTTTAYWLGNVITALVSGWVSPAHDDTAGSNFFLSYDGSTYSWAENAFPGYDKVLIAQAIWDNSNSTWFYTRECHGLETSPDDHLAQHTTIGTYKYSGGTIPSASYVLNSTTAGDRRLNIDQTTIRDEDCPSTLDALTSKLYTKMTLSGANISNFTVETAEIVPVLASNPYYNLFATPNWTQVLMPTNSVATVWIYAIPVTSDTASKKYRYIFVQPQWVTLSANASAGAITTAVNTEEARLPSSLNLGTLAINNPEMIAIARVTIVYTGANWSYRNVLLLTGNKYSQIGSPAGNFLSEVATDTTLTGNGTVADPLSIPSLIRKSGTFTDNDTSQTFTDTDVTTTSIIEVYAQATPAGGWTVVSGTGDFTITSTVAESTDIPFIYYINNN